MSDAFGTLWRTAQSLKQKLHSNLPDSAYDLPYTVSSVIRIREMLDNFAELPKDKRPPESIYFEPEELEDWFDNIFKQGSNKTEIEFSLNEIEGL